MKRLIIIFAAVLAAVYVCAQHISVREDMRVFVKEGEEVLTRFP